MSDLPEIQRVTSVLWPSFLTAAAATILFFTAFDPWLLLASTRFADLSRLGTYTIGFFLFWILTAATALLTCYFRRPCKRADRRSGS